MSRQSATPGQRQPTRGPKNSTITQRNAAPGSGLVGAAPWVGEMTVKTWIVGDADVLDRAQLAAEVEAVPFSAWVRQACVKALAAGMKQPPRRAWEAAKVRVRTYPALERAIRAAATNRNRWIIAALERALGEVTRG